VAGVEDQSANRPKSGKTAPKGRFSVIDRFGGSTPAKPASTEIPEGESVRPSGLIVVHRAGRQHTAAQSAPQKIEEVKPAAKAVAAEKSDADLIAKHKSKMKADADMKAKRIATRMDIQKKIAAELAAKRNKK
jgi:hypothetical protein